MAFVYCSLGRKEVFLNCNYVDLVVTLLNFKNWNILKKKSCHVVQIADSSGLCTENLNTQNIAPLYLQPPPLIQPTCPCTIHSPVCEASSEHPCCFLPPPAEVFVPWCPAQLEPRSTLSCWVQSSFHGCLSRPSAWLGSTYTPKFWKDLPVPP